MEIHQSTIENSGGGDQGNLDIGKLDSVLNHIQNDDYYPTFLDQPHTKRNLRVGMKIVKSVRYQCGQN